MFAYIKSFFKEHAKDTKTIDPLHALSAIDITHHHRGEIRYDPELIRTLNAEHLDLIDSFARVWTDGFEKQNLNTVLALLGEFKRKFQAHLLKENVKLYVFLEQALKDKSDQLKRVKKFRLEMNEIAQQTIRFCKKYQELEIFEYREIRHAFEKEFVAVRSALSKRFEQEEDDLYALYQQSGDD